MKQLTVKKEGQAFKIYADEKLHSEIIFDDNNIDASLLTESKTLRAEKDSNKDVVLKEDGQTLFTFTFDYVWGGAEITSNGVDTGFDIKGRWFKPGTRLTDEHDKDLVIAVKKNDELQVTVLDEDISDTMIVATIYYHIYASGGKMLTVLAGNIH